jgi:hypothetical protein
MASADDNSVQLPAYPAFLTPPARVSSAGLESSRNKWNQAEINQRLNQNNSNTLNKILYTTIYL